MKKPQRPSSGSPELVVHLIFDSSAWEKAFPRMKQKIGVAASEALSVARTPSFLCEEGAEVNILLTTDAKIRKLNHAFRGIDKPTNVLSFPEYPTPSDPAPYLLGDIALAVQTLKRECKEQKKLFENHMIHLIVHGVLHLLGYDHMHSKEAKSMERLECDILKRLGYPPPYDDIPRTIKRSRSISHGK
jgi:probable rRNA maturation factor